MHVGLTVLEVEVGNPATPETTEQVEFLIDPGAVYSVAPRQLLERRRPEEEIHDARELVATYLD